LTSVTRTSFFLVFFSFGHILATNVTNDQIQMLLVRAIAFGVSFNLNLQSQSPFSLFNGTWQKRPSELDYRLRFEIEEMTLQMQ